MLSKKEITNSLISFLKSTITATTVPKCKNASNAAPGKFNFKKYFAITKCPELLTGKNSVNPCINPNNINDIYSLNLWIVRQLPSN
ncbi:hypothetical protein ES708_18950 [subsurface metagenome]